ncbi:MAG TPA: SLC13 family permease [Solirubrobacteraceae bacterium]
MLLAAVLAWAVARPRGLGEVWAAVPAAGLLVLLGALPAHAVGDRARALGPTLGFLAGVLVIGDGCARAGLFAWVGRTAARGARGRPARLLALVFAAAALTTAALSLDATVILLTPSVVAAAAAARVAARPHVYACAHLANGASLLLPVSNLTNLLAFSAAGVAFAHFGALMALPWLAVIAVEWVVLRRFFADDLRGRGAASVAEEPGAFPVYPAAVVAVALIGFGVARPAGIDPAWVAGAGAVALAGPALVRRAMSAREVVEAISPGFLVFVLALSFVVDAAQRNGLDDQVAALVPGGDGLLALLAVAALAAVLANLLNNLPAILVLLPALGSTGAVLAALIGVGVGPNLTYAGSLATLLWRRVLRGHDVEPSAGAFVRLGALAVPPALIAATLALWLSLRLVG